MFKQIATMSVLALSITGCVSPVKDTAFAAESAITITKESYTPDLMDTVKLSSNSMKINKMVSKLKKHVGKTWYVFSGSSPSGWDCSGMTLWAYKQIGIPLEHRASKQQHSGVKVSSPKYGDIVVFKYKGSKSAYHVGIYIDENTMIHAGGGKGDRTSIDSISSFAGKHSKVSYVRMIETSS
jgi:cell wall-associated NlpC family hydrolase